MASTGYDQYIPPGIPPDYDPRRYFNSELPPFYDVRQPDYAYEYHDSRHVLQQEPPYSPRPRSPSPVSSYRHFASRDNFAERDTPYREEYPNSYRPPPNVYRPDYYSRSPSPERFERPQPSGSSYRPQGSHWRPSSWHEARSPVSPTTPWDKTRHNDGRATMAERMVEPSDAWKANQPGWRDTRETAGPERQFHPRGRGRRGSRAARFRPTMLGGDSYRPGMRESYPFSRADSYRPSYDDDEPRRFYPARDTPNSYHPGYAASPHARASHTYSEHDDYHRHGSPRSYDESPTRPKRPRVNRISMVKRTPPYAYPRRRSESRSRSWSRSRSRSVSSTSDDVRPRKKPRPRSRSRSRSISRSRSSSASSRRSRSRSPTDSIRSTPPATPPKSTLHLPSPPPTTAETDVGKDELHPDSTLPVQAQDEPPSSTASSSLPTPLVLPGVAEDAPVAVIEPKPISDSQCVDLNTSDASDLIDKPLQPDEVKVNMLSSVQPTEEIPATNGISESDAMEIIPGLATTSVVPLDPDSPPAPPKPPPSPPTSPPIDVSKHQHQASSRAAVAPPIRSLAKPSALAPSVVSRVKEPEGRHRRSSSRQAAKAALNKQKPPDPNIATVDRLTEGDLREGIETVVVKRLQRDHQSRDELILPVLMANQAIADLPPKKSESYNIVEDIMNTFRHDSKPLTMHFDIYDSLMNHFERREAVVVEKAQQLKEEYLSLHEKWIAHCARLDGMQKNGINDELVAPSGRSTRRSAAMLGDTARSDLEMEQIIASLGIEELTDPSLLAVKNVARIPDMISVSEGTIDYLYDDTNNIVQDPAEFYSCSSGNDIWTDEEREIFNVKFAAHPKQFGLIAEFIPSKTAQQCVTYYYLHKKKFVDFRKVIAQYAPGRRRKNGRSNKAKGNALLADIQRHDDEVSKATKVTEASATGRRKRTILRTTEPRKVTSRRLAAQQDQTPTPTTSTPDPEPDTGTKRKRRGAAARAANATPNADVAEAAEDAGPKKMTRKSRRGRGMTTTHQDGSSAPDVSGNTSRQRTAITSAVWGDADKSLFLTLLGQYGDDFKRIAASMPSKTTAQVSNYYKNHAEELQLDKIATKASVHSAFPELTPYRQDVSLYPIMTAMSGNTPLSSVTESSDNMTTPGSRIRISDLLSPARPGASSFSKSPSGQPFPLPLPQSPLQPRLHPPSSFPRFVSSPGTGDRATLFSNQ